MSGGDMAITASTRRNQPPDSTPPTPARSVKPTNPSGPPQQVAAIPARERMDPADDSPRGAVAPHQATAPALLDGVVAVPRQRGDDVQLVAARRQLVDDAGQHPSGGRGVRLEVRAEHDDARSSSGGRHAGRRRPARAPDRAAREPRRSSRVRRRPARRAGRRTSSSASAQASTVERPHEPGVADDLRQRRPVAASAPACRAPSPRARAPRSPRTRTGTPGPRRRRRSRHGRRR